MQPSKGTAMVQELHEDVMHMGDLVRDAVAKANRALLQGDKARGDEVIAGDDLVDRMELAIARKCIDLLTSGQSIGNEEQREVTAILKVITDLERIADLAEEVALISREISPRIRLRSPSDWVRWQISHLIWFRSACMPSLVAT